MSMVLITSGHLLLHALPTPEDKRLFDRDSSGNEVRDRRFFIREENLLPLLLSKTDLNHFEIPDTLVRSHRRSLLFSPNKIYDQTINQICVAIEIYTEDFGVLGIDSFREHLKLRIGVKLVLHDEIGVNFDVWNAEQLNWRPYTTKV